MSTEHNDPAQDPKQASLLSGETGDAAAQAVGAHVAAPVDATVGAPGAAVDAATDATTEAAPTAAAGDAAAVTDIDTDTAMASAAAEAALPDGARAGDAVPAESAELAEPEIPNQLPGEFLAARRIEMRLSIEELSARVKLAPRQLIALEANDFGSLPGMATTRGFIRSCAKTMGMAPEPLLAMLAQEPNPALSPMVMRRPLPQPGFNGRRYGPSTSHRRSANKLSGLAAVIVIFVGMLSYIAWRNDWLHLPDVDFSLMRDAVDSSSANAAPDAQPSATEAAGTEPAASAPAAPTAAVATTATTATTAAIKTPSAPADNEVYAPAAPVAVAPAAAKAEPAKTASATKAATIDPARALELKLREDSWVEVLTQNGERKLLSRLIKAGSTERIDLTEPLILVVGNASGVDVTLRGQPVSLKSGTRDNVAKVSLK